VRAPQAPGTPPLDAVRHRVRTIRAERATDRRSDGSVTAVRAATEDGYHGGIFVVSAPSSSSIHLRWLPAPAHASRAAIPVAPPAIAAATLSSRPRSRSPPANHSTSFPRPSAPPGVTCCPSLRPPRRKPGPPRQPPPASVDPPRRQPLRPNSDRLSTLGELLVEHSRLPGREHRRLAGIGRSRAAPHAQGPNCRVRDLSRVFGVNFRTCL
jgi:hypothetical protein